MIGADYPYKEIKIYTTIFKEYNDVFSLSYEEILGIDPQIVEHEIKNYPNAKPIQQKLQIISPRKSPTIIYGIEKWIKVRFIYLVPLTNQVPNPILVNKKEGENYISMDFYDLCDFNVVGLKDNYLTPFINQIIDDFSSDQMFPFMDVFSYYNQIQIPLEDQHNATFIYQLGAFTYKKMSFNRKHSRATFHQAMSYALNDINKTFEAYLENIPIRSKKRDGIWIFLKLFLIDPRNTRSC